MILQLHTFTHHIRLQDVAISSNKSPSLQKIREIVQEFQIKIVGHVCLSSSRQNDLSVQSSADFFLLISFKMAFNALSKVSKNFSKTLFHSSRMTVNYWLIERELSDSSSKSETEVKSEKKPSESASKDKEGVKNSDPYAAYPNDVNPVTGEKGGPRGPEPTRYGDWERKGRCIDF